MLSKNFVVVLFLCFFQVACNGDAENSTAFPEGNSHGTDGALSGKLYVDIDDTYHEIDMSTGRINSLFPYTRNSEALFEPIDGGESFISAIRVRDDNYNTVVSIRTLNRSGDVLDTFSFYGDDHSRPVATIDSSLIALFWFPEMVSLDKHFVMLMIFRNGCRYPAT